MSYQTDACDVRYGNICYTYHSNRLTWQQASDACVALGGQLVDIEDDTEHEMLGHRWFNIRYDQIISLIFYC